MKRKKEKQAGKERGTRKKGGDWNKELLPLLIMGTFLPLISGFKQMETPLGNRPWLPNETVEYDFFLYWKMVLLLVLGIWMTAVLADRILIRRKKLQGIKAFLPLLIYVLLAFLSTILSVNKTVSTVGMSGMFENIWVLTVYALTAFYVAQTVTGEKDMQLILLSLTTGGFLQGLLGLTQLLGVDFWNTGFGKMLLTIGADVSMREKMVFRFGQNGENQVYMALYNPNYVGVYTVLLLFVVIAFMFVSRKLWEKAFAAVTAVLLAVGLLGSRSKTGFVVLLMLAMVALIFSMAEGDRRGNLNVRRGLFLLAGVGFVTAAGFLYDSVSGNTLQKAIQKSLRKVDAYKMEDVIAKEDFVELHYRGHVLELSVKDGLLQVEEKGKNKELFYLQDQNCFVMKGKAFRGVAFYAEHQEAQDIVLIYCNRSQFIFVKPEGQAYTYVTPYGKADEIVAAQSCLFDGHEKALSNRGYIWGRTIPLLKRFLLWGSGPDTFIEVFPQNDYLMRANTSPQLMQQILSKPHNMYLQTAVQTGMLSLICLLGFWGNYLFGALKRMKSLEKTERVIQGGIVLAVLGYLLMGIMNDSSLAVAPIFWLLLGMGVGLNESGYVSQQIG